MALTATGFQADRHNLLTAAPANPGAGNGLAWPCPANRVVQVVGVRITLTTAVAVANRYLHVSILSAGDETPASPSVLIQIASLVWTYHFTTGIAPWDASTAAGFVYAPLGCCYQLKTGETLQVGVLNMQAADALSSARIRYFEWYED